MILIDYTKLLEEIQKRTLIDENIKVADLLHYITNVWNDDMLIATRCRDCRYLEKGKCTLSNQDISKEYDFCSLGECNP